MKKLFDESIPFQHLVVFALFDNKPGSTLSLKLAVQSKEPGVSLDEEMILKVVKAQALARGYKGPLTISVVPNLTEKQARSLYDQLPGEKISDGENEKFVKLLGPDAWNARVISTPH